MSKYGILKTPHTGSGCHTKSLDFRASV